MVDVARDKQERGGPPSADVPTGSAERARPATWSLAALILLAVGFALQIDVLVYAMYVLLGVMLVSRYLSRSWIDNITATRECSRLSAEIGDKAAVVVHIKNGGRVPVVWLLTEDSLPRDALRQKPPRLKVEQKRLALKSLKPGQQTSVLYQVTFLMRGYYQIGPMLVESGDLFGLHRRYKILTEPAYVLVPPKVVPLAGYDISSRRPIGEIRMAHRLFEDPTRISGVREYAAGDPLSRIHWKATARTGTLHSKVFEPSCVAGMSILLDFDRRNYTDRAEPMRSELAVTTVASLANAVYLMGQQIGFYTNARDAADRIREEGWKPEFRTRDAAKASTSMAEESDRLRPVTVETRRGPDQLQRILESLARVELTDGLRFTDLILEVASRLPRDATVVVVLPDVSPEVAIAVGSLKRRGFAVTAVLVMYDDEDHYADCVGRLLAVGVDVRHVENEQMLSALCSQQAVGA